MIFSAHFLAVVAGELVVLSLAAREANGLMGSTPPEVVGSNAGTSLKPIVFAT